MMDNNYKLLVKILEEIDPANLGAVGEYDDVAFALVKRAQGKTEVNEVAEILRQIMREELESCDDFSVQKTAEELIKNFPSGLRL